MHECTQHTIALYPKFEKVPSEKEDEENYQKNKYYSFSEAYNNYSLMIKKYAPFYNENFYDCFLKIKEDCSQIGNYFDCYKLRNKEIPLELEKINYTLQENIENLQKDLCIEIRNYLLSLEWK
jgi:hypothetical protein